MILTLVLNGTLELLGFSYDFTRSLPGKFDFVGLLRTSEEVLGLPKFAACSGWRCGRSTIRHSQLRGSGVDGGHESKAASCSPEIVCQHWARGSSTRMLEERETVAYQRKYGRHPHNSTCHPKLPGRLPGKA